MMFPIRKALPDLMLSGISSNLRLNWSSLAAQACEKLEKAVNFLSVFDIPACSNDDPSGKIKALVHRSCGKIGQSYLKDINTPENIFSLSLQTRISVTGCFIPIGYSGMVLFYQFCNSR